jgi:hypothetical protein
MSALALVKAFRGVQLIAIGSFGGLWGMQRIPKLHRDLTHVFCF